MKGKKIVGIIVIIVGVVLFGVSNYIQNQIGEGKEKIAAAQKKLDQGQSLFSVSPVTKELGKGVISSGQKKINAANRTVAYYQDLAQKLQIGGIALVVVGALFLFVVKGQKKKKKS